ncbi:hypothetical protein [Saccharopolyspora elongata]|uniref:hypothetical protein n=1 Tax=Saccharopolyspora elongata TaxID=2530387 RepID=UPI0014055D6A|nr:hypothetical protein [Saccharopolyspora elongata]
MPQQSHVDTATNSASASGATDTEQESTPRPENPEATFYDHEESHLILGYN